MKTKSSSALGNLLEIIITIVITVFVYFLLAKFVFANEVIVGPSMQPTFNGNDRVIALRMRTPKRQDVVILKAPDAPGEFYIKRVIGMPGDAVSYKDDTLYVNNKKVSEPYLDQYKKEYASFDTPLTSDFSLNTLKPLDGAKKVPTGKYFVMGDNRPQSKDSRMIGFISKDAIEGVVSLRYWPLNKIKTF